MRTLLVAGVGAATSAFVAAVMLARPEAHTATTVVRPDAPPVRARASKVQAVAPARVQPRERPMLRRPPVRRAVERPRSAADIAADEELETRALDRLAQQRFDTAFDAESRDDAWAEETEQTIVAAIEATKGALRLDAVSCRATLCRVVLDGERDALPSIPPFDGVGWWTDGARGRSTLLLVRDGAEPPLPSELDV